MTCRFRAAVATVAVTLLSHHAQANDLFTINVNVTAPTEQSAAGGFNTVTDVINQLKSQNLGSLVSSYNQNAAASAEINLRGVTAIASYPLNSTSLNFVVPSAGINVTFTGATRDDSQKMLLDWLLRSGGSDLTRLLQTLAANSPVDPVAGNPSSLQVAMARDDFTIGTGIGLVGTEIPHGGLAGQPNLFTLGGEVGLVSSGGYSSTVVTLPLRYTLPFADPRFAITFDLPLTYINTQGATTGYGSLGVSLRIPLLKN